jgi:hypothetical protein
VSAFRPSFVPWLRRPFYDFDTEVEKGSMQRQQFDFELYVQAGSSMDVVHQP